jgi:hypothetical protein
VRKSLVGLSERELTAFPIPGKWSIKEIAVHLVDSEIIGAGRIRRVLAQPATALDFYDQDLSTKALRHNEQSSEDLQNTLHAFEALRNISGALFRAAAADDWNKTGIHYNYGNISLHRLLELYADHSERHIDQILERRRLLGNIVAIEPILSVRLY